MQRVGDLTDDQLRTLMRWTEGADPLPDFASEHAGECGLAKIAGMELIARLAQGQRGIPAEVFAELLALPPYGSSRSLIGEAAQDCELTPEQLQAALGALDEAEWSHKQVRGQSIADSLKRSESAAHRQNSIDELLIGRWHWQLRHVLPSLSVAELRYVVQRCDAPAVLTRRDRHAIRELAEASISHQAS